MGHYGGGVGGPQAGGCPLRLLTAANPMSLLPLTSRNQVHRTLP